MYEYTVFCAHDIDQGWQTFHHLLPGFREKVLAVTSGANHPHAIIILMKSEMFAVARSLVLLFVASVYSVCSGRNSWHTFGS
jgi:hypothetical protein